VSKKNVDQVVLIAEDLRVAHMNEYRRKVGGASSTAHTITTAAAGDVATTAPATTSATGSCDSAIPSPINTDTVGSNNGARRKITPVVVEDGSSEADDEKEEEVEDASSDYLQGQVNGCYYYLVRSCEGLH
jgi:hypothetical protein